MTIHYLDEHLILNRKKKSIIILNLNGIIDLAVDYTLLLYKEADAKNIKNCIKIIINKFKEDYDNVKIKF